MSAFLDLEKNISFSDNLLITVTDQGKIAGNHMSGLYLSEFRNSFGTLSDLVQDLFETLLLIAFLRVFV